MNNFILYLKELIKLFIFIIFSELKFIKIIFEVSSFTLFKFFLFNKKNFLIFISRKLVISNFVILKRNLIKYFKKKNLS